MSARIGFIGLGLMGRGMAANLLDAGYDLAVWNRTASRMDALVEKGAKPAGSPAELAADSDIIFVCVSDTPDVEEVLFGGHGVVRGARRGTLVVDHSTISPSATRDFGARLGEEGIAMLDAPVSGGSEGAANGTLSIMVGGTDEDFARARPYFDVMGKTVTHVGELGDGQTVKLVNQILVVGNALAMSEAIVFARRAGLDLEKTLEAVSGGAAGSWMLSNRGPQILEDYWEPGFTIDLQQKDVRLALEEAAALGAPVMATALVHQLYAVLQREGLGGEGNHALIKAVERLAAKG